jgi:hypothetical protein
LLIRENPSKIGSRVIGTVCLKDKLVDTANKKN